MRIDRTYRYDGDVAGVLAIIRGPELYQEAAIRSRSLSYDVDVSEADGSTTIVLRRSLPTDQVPSFAQGFVGETVDVVESTRWAPLHDGRADGVFDVSIERTPVRFHGTMTLAAPSGIEGMPGVEQRIGGELKAGVPLLGRRIEESIAPLIGHQLDVLAEIVGTRLAQAD
jgi:hypothetical protein